MAANDESCKRTIVRMEKSYCDFTQQEKDEFEARINKCAEAISSVLDGRTKDNGLSPLEIHDALAGDDFDYGFVVPFALNKLEDTGIIDSVAAQVSQPFPYEKKKYFLKKGEKN